MIRAQQPGSQPIDIPEAIPNPAVIPAAPLPAPPRPAPREPAKEPERVPADWHPARQQAGHHGRVPPGRLARIRRPLGPRR